MYKTPAIQQDLEKVQHGYSLGLAETTPLARGSRMNSSMCTGQVRSAHWVGKVRSCVRSEKLYLMSSCSLQLMQLSEVGPSWEIQVYPPSAINAQGALQTHRIGADHLQAQLRSPLHWCESDETEAEGIELRLSRRSHPDASLLNCPTAGSA